MVCGEVCLDPSAAVGVFSYTHYAGAVYDDIYCWHLGSGEGIDRWSWDPLLNGFHGLDGNVLCVWEVYYRCVDTLRLGLVDSCDKDVNRRLGVL